MATGDKKHLLNKEEVIQSIGNISAPILDLPLTNSLDYNIGNGNITFERGTNATYIDRYGVLQYADIDEPRFEKDGLLIEGSSTNTLDNSLRFMAAEANIVYDYSVAPDGSNTAIGVTVDNDGDCCLAYTYIFTDYTAGDIYTCSVFVKKQDYDHVTFNCYFLGESEYNYDFNFNTEIASNEALKVQKLSNGWYRLSLSITAINNSEDDSNSPLVRLRVWATGRSYHSSEATIGLYNLIWGAQIEKLPFATSYIPTTDSAVTRGEDKCYIDTMNNISGRPFTFSLDIKQIGVAGTTGYIFASYVNGDNYIRLYNNASDNLLRFSFNENAVSSSLSKYIVQKNEYIALVYSVDADKINQFVNNTLTDTVLTNTVFTGNIVKNQPITFGAYQPERKVYFYGHIKNFKIYDRALTPTEIELS